MYTKVPADGAAPAAAAPLGLRVRLRPVHAAGGPLHSAKGGAVETGCSGLHDVIGCFTI